MIVIVSHDLTIKERENAKALYQEAKRWERLDTSDGYKFKVRGPPGDMKIIKIKINHTTTNTKKM